MSSPFGSAPATPEEEERVKEVIWLAGKTSQRKGRRREQEAAKLLGGSRVPLSGASGGQFAGDIILPNGWKAEVKSRKEGFKNLYAWLEGFDVLLLKADRKPWLAVLGLEQLRTLLAKPQQKE